MTTVQIHVANILEVNPGPIQCMGLNEITFKLALFRGGADASIELWDVSHLPFRQNTFTDLEKVDGNASVESIVWVKDRLFSCGLHGFIIEHDLSTGLIKGKTAATSGPVWCLGVSPNELFLAAGTEDGFVNIFQIFDEGLVYLKVLDRQEGRHLCLSWSPCGNFIASGSIDSIRVWDVEKGHALQRLMTGRTKNTETIVWSILMLDDYLIVTGDSRGIISFWDGKIGVLKHKIFSHKADILSLKLSSDQCSIYATGVDPTVVLLSRVGKSGDKWVKSHQRNMHTNDVMCLASHGNRLFSAGIDADLVVSSFPPKMVNKYPPIPPAQNIHLSRTSKQVLVKNWRGVDIWQLPGDSQELVKLVELGSRKKDVILAACLSPSGQFFAYSTDDKINFFRLSMVTGPGACHAPQPKLKKLSSHVSNEFDNLLVSSLHFLNEELVLVLSESNLVFIEINTETDLYCQRKKYTLNPDKYAEIGGNIISLIETATRNNDGYFYIALGNSGNSVILILKIKADDFSVTNCQTVPRYRCQPTALAFHPTLPYILIAYADHSLKVFNFSSGKIVYNEKLGKPGGNVPYYQPVLGAAWSQSGDHIVLHEVDKLYLMKLHESQEADAAVKKSKRNSTEENSIRGKEKLNFSVQTCENKYKFLAFVGFLDEGNELLVVEVKPNSLLEKLPPAFAKKRFGM